MNFIKHFLLYVVKKKPKQAKKVYELIANIIKTRFEGVTGIVYVFSQKECNTVAEELQKLNISAKAYHAGISTKKRSKIQQEWQEDKIQVVVATVAFGLGINKPDVVFVIQKQK